MGDAALRLHRQQRRARWRENQQFRPEQGPQWYDWIDRRVRENMPYDKLVEGIVLAASRQPGQSFDDYCAEMSSYFRTDDPADFTARATMPYFWTRRTSEPARGEGPELRLRLPRRAPAVRRVPQAPVRPVDQAGLRPVHRVLHRRRTTARRNDDRDAFQKMQDELDVDKKLNGNEQRNRSSTLAVKEGKIVPWREVFVDASRSRAAAQGDDKNARSAGRVITPKLLGGDEVVASEYADPRQPLMDWMRPKDNPYFARAFVNRVWANYFNVGIIEPPDDMNLANPPSNAPLLDYLTERVRRAAATT